MLPCSEPRAVDSCLWIFSCFSATSIRSFTTARLVVCLHKLRQQMLNNYETNETTLLRHRAVSDGFGETIDDNPTVRLYGALRAGSQSVPQCYTVYCVRRCEPRSVGAVASSMGFSDSYHMTRGFGSDTRFSQKSSRGPLVKRNSILPLEKSADIVCHPVAAPAAI